MDEGSKQRLVGAAVLVGIAVIFFPMLFEESDQIKVGDPIEIPERPDFDTAYQDSLTKDLEPTSDTAASLQTLSNQGSLALPLPERPTSQPPSTAAAPPPDRDTTMMSGAPPIPSPPAPAKAAAPVGQAVPKAPMVSSETDITGWVVQVASLSERDKAISLRDELRRAGYKVFVETARIGGKDYFRVRIGPEASRSLAESLSQRLTEETKYKKSLVQSYP